jgi:FkbM family methyltransferase
MYQRLCIESSIACGFRIISVNDREEISQLSTQYPEVTFVQADRNASEISGRKTPFIADLLTALSKTPENTVGIINSDILFEPSRFWLEELPQAVKHSVVLSRRYDTVSLSRSIPEKYLWGFDSLFFEKERISGIIENSLPFAMGMPWWDCWLPVALAFKGCEIRMLESPSIIHLDHGKGFNRRSWRYMARRLIEYIVRSSNADESAIPPKLKSLVARCRRITDFSGIDRGDLDGEFGAISWLCTNELQASSVQTTDVRAAPPLHNHASDLLDRGDAIWLPPFPAIEKNERNQELTSLDTFHALQAVSLRASADTLFRQQKLPEAELIYRTILSKYPDDVHSLRNMALILKLQRNVQDAIALLQKAVNVRPGDLLAQVYLGIIFAEMNKKEEAIACFKRAIAINPDFEDRDHLALAHFNLARLLNSNNNLKQAMSHLEKALACKPDYPAAAEGYYDVRQALRAPKGPDIGAARHYFSQSGEDALLDEFFHFKATGYFIDVGSFDGIHLSNTYAFERRGWLGLCVEAAPSYYELCRTNRPRSRCVNVACTADESTGAVEFDFEPGGLFSGVKVDKKFVSDTHMKAQVPFQGFQCIRIPSSTLNSLLGNAVTEIDFVSIDVEGSEIDVLAGFNLERYKPRVLLIEANTAEERKALDAYLGPRGYRYARSITWNHFYVRSEDDQRALRAITVSAKLEHPPHPLGTVHSRFGYASHPYVYWPAEK